MSPNGNTRIAPAHGRLEATLLENMGEPLQSTERQKAVFDSDFLRRLKAVPGLYPEDDIFIQLMKLKNSRAGSAERI